VSSVMLFCDNKSTINLASNPAHHEQSKHIDIDHHFIREYIQSKVVKLVHVKSQHQVVDVFTKALPGPIFGKF
ncbi:Copia protein, partial [Glycine soja]